ncbi:MAG: replicative DNA helicase [Isosphaeraceae bacterium]
MSAAYQGPGNGKGNHNGNGNGPGRPSRPDTTALGDRLPPQNLEAERGVLGSVLLDNDVLHEIVPILSVPDFYRDVHQTIYQAIRDMYDAGKGVDAITLADELIRRDQFDKIGGDETLTEIVDSVRHAANAKYYAGIVREKSISRQLIDSATEIIRDGYSNLYTASELLETAERKVFAIAEEQIQGDTRELKDIITTAMDNIAARADSGGHAVTGVASGLIDLDDITGGFQPGQLVVLAARPSMGKTALALNICDHAAMEMKTAVMCVSLEMGHLEIAERLLCARSRIDGYKLRTGMGLGNREMTQLAKAYSELQKGSPIFIDDTPARNMLQITAAARRLRLRSQIGLIVVDYIQLVDSEESRDSRQEQIAKISRRLKTLARELEVPVIALSQLNRAVESREDRRPRMADLRESGAIEQDADIVLLLHRPDYYDPNDQPGIGELIVAKNRNGRTDTVKLTFLKNFMRFENLATVAEPLDEGGSPF